MKRLLLITFAALILAASPAFADHTSMWYGHMLPRTVTWEDRTGRPDMQSWIQSAVARWNEAGANITLLYKTGPATNSCAAATYATVRFCIVPNISGYKEAAFFPEGFGTPGHITGGYIEFRADQLGPYGPLHEGGHSLGLAHSTLASVMNQSNTLRTNYVTDHDKEAVRSIYSHSDSAPPSTTTTTRFSLCTRYPQYCR